MATYYVAPDGQGDNGDTGGIGGPWSTLAYAVTQVSSSDVIYIQVGIHTIDTTVSVPIGVSLIGAGDTSIITTTNATEWNVTLNLISAEGINGNQSISYLYFDGNLIGAWCINVTGRSNVWVHDCTFIDWDTYAIHFRGRTDNTANPPTIYSTGNKFYNNTATNSSRYRNGFGTGVLNIGGQTGMEIYNNTITSGSRTAGTNGWPIKDANGGCLKGLKIYNNTLINDDVTNWDFSIELFYVWGFEAYNNNLTGCIDLNFVSKGDYEYGAYIHNNTIGPETESSKYYTGVTLEFDTSDVIIEHNRFRNCCDAIRWSPRDGTIIENTRISYNIFENIGSDTFAWGAIRLWQYTGAMFLSGNFNVYNNVFYAKSPVYEHGAWYGIGIGGFTTATEINIINNIFIGFSAYWLILGSCDNLITLNVRNNIVYNNQNSNLPSITGTPTNNNYNAPIIDNPDFTTAGSDFTLQVGSPAIDAGLYVGLTTDYLGRVVPFSIAPDIGAYEYGSSLTLIEGTWLANRTTLNAMFQNLYNRTGH